MISVEEAWSRVLEGVKPLATEEISIMDALGRTLAEDVSAERTTPPDDISAMDGYALRYDDLANLPKKLEIIGEAPAGTPFDGEVQKGQCARIFTGGVVPFGADTVVIQENTERDGNWVSILEAPERGRNIRKAGMDFTAGDILVEAGKPLNERDISLIAGGNKGEIKVFRQPSVALIANGDELVSPGGKLTPGSVINSNTPALSALLQTAGAKLHSTEIVPDNLEALVTSLQKAASADLIVTLGGASVGDYDYVLEAFEKAGGKMDFWKIAMKPGKPLMFGVLEGKPVFGLPGNPNSAYVTAFLFLLPLIRGLLGQTMAKPHSFPARAGGDIPKTGDRELFLLAALSFSDKDASFIATPHPRQDSARMATLQAAHALIRRKPFQDPAKAGDVVEVLPLPTH